MVKFAYNNGKNASTGHTSFELNCGYYPKVFWKKGVDPCSKSRSTDKEAIALHKLISVYKNNLQYVQELQKQFHDKHAKSRSYALSKKFGSMLNTSKPNKTTN